MPPFDPWLFLVIGYTVSVAIETPILVLGLSRHHSLRRRLGAGLWLTACTYPVVILTLPVLLEPRWLYLVVAETFAPVAECLLFWAAFHEGKREKRTVTWRDWAVIALANLASFTVAEALYASGWWS